MHIYCVGQVRPGFQSCCPHKHSLLENGHTSPGTSKCCPDLCRQTSGSPPLFFSKGLGLANDSRKLQSAARGFEVEHGKPCPNPGWQPLGNADNHWWHLEIAWCYYEAKSGLLTEPKWSLCILPWTQHPLPLAGESAIINNSV